MRERLRLKRVHELSLGRQIANTAYALIGTVVNFIAPLAGLMPLSFQHYLRDQWSIFRQLEPKSAVSASAIYLLAFALLGLGDIVGGTLLIDGIRISYPFPQKEFGVEVIRQMPLIELSRSTTVVFFTLLFADSSLRLYFNHGRDQAMGFLGPVGIAIKCLARMIDGGEWGSAEPPIQQSVQGAWAYKASLMANGEDNRQRGAAAFQRFLNAKGAK